MTTKTTDTIKTILAYAYFTAVICLWVFYPPIPINIIHFATTYNWSEDKSCPGDMVRDANYDCHIPGKYAPSKITSETDTHYHD